MPKVTAKQVMTRWAGLYSDLVILQKIKRDNPKNYNVIKIQLRDLAEDIGDALKDLSLSDDDIDVLVDTLKKVKRYQAV